MRNVATLGGPYCPPLKIRFPVVYRVVQSMSRAQLDAFGAYDEEPFNGVVHYTLDDETRIREKYPGDITFAPLSHGPPEPDAPTLVVRYHPSKAHMEGYSTALFDMFDCPSEDEDAAATPIGSGESGRSEGGLFTLTLRPAHRIDASQPGALLIYLAKYPRTDPLPGSVALLGELAEAFGNEEWYLALAADGAEVRLSDLDPPETVGRA